jgi:putative ABC transport system substrate-binding protein
MKRRTFITLVGGAAAIWSLAARAQQGTRRVGILVPFVADDAVAQARVAAFLQGLQQSGWEVGRNLRVETLWAGSNSEEIRRCAAELVALAPDVILASGSAVMGPLLQATRSVPVVFAIVPDPVGAGYVESLARPGGNATGFTNFDYGIGGKWVELLKQVAPAATRAGIIRDPAISAGLGMLGAIQAVAPTLGVEVSPIDVRDAREIERAVAAFARQPNSGLIVTGSAWAVAHRLGGPAQAPRGLL